MAINIFWFRRDLRLNDNAALFHILNEQEQVQPIFIFDTQILNKLQDKQDKRVNFIYRELATLKQKLAERGGELWVFYGKPSEVFSDLIHRQGVGSVYANHDYEPEARQRDEEIKKLLEEKDIPFHTFKDQVIFEKEEVVKKDGSPYTVFSPYSRKWKEKFTEKCCRQYDSEPLLDDRLNKTLPSPMPLLQAIGFQPLDVKYPSREIRENILGEYDKTRDLPALDATSRLGIHLRFGTISIRELAAIAEKTNETFLNELIWREFFMQILWHFPKVVKQSFKTKYDNIEWRNREEDFQKWCAGKTGFPIVDAGMRELNETGFMHNRVRMVVASFLTKDLLIDWRWGESYFAEKLLDYELASNNGNWQWAAGSGCDAAPYFRIFNPLSQTKKFDPEYHYIRKWVKELDSPDYSEPMIDHAFARERCLEVFKKALN